MTMRLTIATVEFRETTMPTAPSNSPRRSMFAPISLMTGLICLGCSAAVSPPSPKPDPKVIGLLGGSDGYTALVEASRVEAFRIGSVVATEDSEKKAPGGYSEIAGPVVLSEQSVGRLKVKLSDPNAFLWHLAKGCEFDPGVRFDFIRGADRLQVLVCFGCDELKVFRNGERVGGEDFDPIRSDLIQVAQQTFPDDDTIQSLKP